MKKIRIKPVQLEKLLAAHEDFPISEKKEGLRILHKRVLKKFMVFELFLPCLLTNNNNCVILSS